MALIIIAQETFFITWKNLKLIFWIRNISPLFLIKQLQLLLYTQLRIFKEMEIWKFVDSLRITFFYFLNWILSIVLQLTKSSAYIIFVFFNWIISEKDLQITRCISYLDPFYSSSRGEGVEIHNSS